MRTDCLTMAHLTCFPYPSCFLPCIMPKGLSAIEQELACLHADALALHFRLELEDGWREAAARASARRCGALAASARRDAQAAVFGARTAKQRREDALKAEAAGHATTNPAVRPRVGVVTCAELHRSSVLRAAVAHTCVCT